MASEQIEAPERVWMHNSLGYWFSVADECRENGDVEYIRADLVATSITTERERCAKIAKEHSATDCQRQHKGSGPDCGAVIAAEIRNQSGEKNSESVK